ncbi:MAG: hypothetical protein ACRERU_03490 [Methylococcales bacterium]
MTVINVFGRNLLAACVISVAAVQTANAYSSAQATIDWDSFTVQYTDLSGGTNSPLLTWTSEFGIAGSTAFNQASIFDSQSYSQSAFDFSSVLSTNTSTAGVQSNSLRDAHVLQAAAAAQSSSNPFFSYASAGVINAGYFSLTDNGVALITVDSQISVDGVPNDSMLLN